MSNVLAERPLRRIPVWLLAAFMLLPAAQTAVSVYWEWHTAITYPALKLLMVVSPIAVWLTFRRSGAEVRRLVGLKRTSLLPGLAVGACVQEE